MAVNKTDPAASLTRELRDVKLQREFTVTRDAVDVDARTVDIAFSSEEPFERWFGMEILDHGKKSIRLDRMKNGAAFLVNHDTRDQVGVIESVEIGNDRRGRASVRFGRGARADEIFQDIVDGIRQHISVGYLVHKMVLEEERDDGPSVYRVTDWEPYESSTVPVPADTSVGVGRSLDDGDDNNEPDDVSATTEVGNTMKDDDKKIEAPEVDVNQIKESARQAEQERIREITAVGDRHDQAELARQYVGSGQSVSEFNAAVLERMGKIVPVTESAEIGLTEKETRRFSYVKAINYLANPGDQDAREDAAFEIECSTASQKRTRRQVKGSGIQVPAEVLRGRRDMTVGTDADGGYLVGTDQQGFIDILRNKSVLMQAGAQELTGLVGDVAIPRLDGSATFYWIAGDGADSLTESTPTMAQLALTPKTGGAHVDISRKLLLQATPDAEMMVKNDLAAVTATGVDYAGLHGSGASNQPTGVIATTGIGDVAGGTNGAAPDYADIVDLETEVAMDNADVGSLAYITNAVVRGKMRQAFPNTTGGDTPVWTGGAVGQMNGYPAYATNQVLNTLEKNSSGAVCSAIFFGNWNDLIIGHFGGQDLIVDPYTNATSGLVRVVIMQSIDIGVRHVTSFAAMKDALANPA